MKVDGQRMQVDHYRMVGDEERELWFDPEGHVAKVEFERRGSEIEYRAQRGDPAPAALTVAGARSPGRLPPICPAPTAAPRTRGWPP